MNVNKRMGHIPALERKKKKGKDKYARLWCVMGTSPGASVIRKGIRMYVILCQVERVANSGGSFENMIKHPSHASAS